MTLGSLFAGIGGFDYGFELAGFETIWQVEKEPFCIAVLKKHFPNVERYYEIKDCGHDRKHKLRAVDVVTAGFPCQDLSVAGKRAGLAGTRSGLFWELVRILGELRPNWFVIENVPGLFSSESGRDFAIVLRELGNLGYGLAWRVLDSQYFGVAQRRRRVFIVGCFGKPCPAEVLFESEGGEGNFTQSAKERPELALDIAGSLRGVGGTPRGFNLDAEQGLAVTVGTIATNTGPNGHDAGNLCSNQAVDAGYIVPTLSSNGDAHSGFRDERGLAVAFAQNQRGELRTSRISPQLTTGGGKPGEGYSAVAYRSIAGTIKRPSGGWRVDAEEAAADGFLVGAKADTNGVRDFASLPEGLDSARYRALGNAVTANVAQWIAERIKANFIPA